MGRRSNFNDEPDAEHRIGNFTSRLRTTIDSELEPEQVTPNTAGAEELTEYENVFPLTRQFSQTNMRTPTGRGRTGSDDQRQSKDRRKRTEERKSGSLG